MSPPTVLLYDFPASICCQMTRLTLAEKGVTYDKRLVDISGRQEQFEPWYLKLNPKGVVPTLAIGDEILTDTMKITPRIDAEFAGPALMPAGDEAADGVRTWMREIMAIHYGVLLYSGPLDETRVSPRMVGRLAALIGMREDRPEFAELLDARIAGNRRLQATLLDPAAVEQTVQSIRSLVEHMDESLASTAFLGGDAYSLADAFATAALARCAAHGYAGWWANGRLASVSAYYQRMQARPSWTAAGVQS